MEVSAESMTPVRVVHGQQLHHSLTSDLWLVSLEYNYLRSHKLFAYSARRLRFPPQGTPPLTSGNLHPEHDVTSLAAKTRIIYMRRVLFWGLLTTHFIIIVLSTHVSFQYAARCYKVDWTLFMEHAYRVCYINIWWDLCQHLSKYEVRPQQHNITSLISTSSSGTKCDCHLFPDTDTV